MTKVYDAPDPVAVRATDRGRMQVGPHGEGEREVLVRMLCGLAGGVSGALFAATVVGNVDRTLTYPWLGAARAVAGPDRPTFPGPWSPVPAG